MQLVPSKQQQPKPTIIGVITLPDPLKKKAADAFPRSLRTALKLGPATLLAGLTFNVSMLSPERIVVVLDDGTCSHITETDAILVCKFKSNEQLAAEKRAAEAAAQKSAREPSQVRHPPAKRQERRAA